MGFSSVHGRAFSSCLCYVTCFLGVLTRFWETYTFIFLGHGLLNIVSLRLSYFELVL